MPPFLRDRAAQVVTVSLLAGCALFYGIASAGERLPPFGALAQIPKTIGPWVTVQETPIQPEVQAVLRADDSLMRTYVSGNTAANLFVAFFKSQRAGVSPHSPKNCLPGSGWVPSQSDIVDVPIPGRAEPIEVNRYIVSKGDTRSYVMYWYQSHDRVIASEYSAKIHLVLDSIRYRRSDTSIVRVIVPMAGDDGMDRAAKTAVEFVQAAFSPISAVLPN